MSDENNTIYFVFGVSEGILYEIDTYFDLKTAKEAAIKLAKSCSGDEIHVAKLLTTFRAETVVKEV